jgi:hypothetical protein
MIICWIVCLSSALATNLMGDFNINLETDSPEKRELLDILDIFSLLMILTTHHQASTIDLILASIPESLRSTTQYGCPGISHHDIVGASFKISLIRQPMTFTRRSFRNIDHATLIVAVAYLPWDSIGSLPDANVRVLRLYSLLVALLARFVPLRTYNHREANSLMMLFSVLSRTVIGRILVIGLQGHLRIGIGSALYVTRRRRL